MKLAVQSTLNPLARNAAIAGLLAILFSVAGCATHDVSQVGTDTRRDISFAATAKYPGNPQTSPQVQAVAITEPERDRLTIYNLSNETLPGGALWVNNAYVRRMDSIPPRGSLTVPYSDLIEAGPGVNDLKSLGQTVTRVELQTPSGLFTVQGPVHR